MVALKQLVGFFRGIFRTLSGMFLQEAPSYVWRGSEYASGVRLLTFPITEKRGATSLML